MSAVSDLGDFNGPVLSWLRSHHGTVTAAILGAAGVSVDQRERLVQRGVLRRVVGGAYHHTATELTELGRCAALCTARSDVVVAGPTAARLWRLRRAVGDGKVHVLAEPGSHPGRAEWLVPYRTALRFPDEVVVRPDGIRVTSPPRTVVDNARFLDTRALASMIEHAIALGYCTPSTLMRTAERLDTPGRPWVRRFLSTLGHRYPGKASESEPELQVYKALRSRNVDDLVRQHTIMLRGYGGARFDMAIPDLRWALEIDVHPEHRSVEGVANDRRRDDAAEEIGWVVRRLSDAELMAFDVAIEGVLNSIARRRATLALAQ